LAKGVFFDFLFFFFKKKYIFSFFKKINGQNDVVLGWVGVVVLEPKRCSFGVRGKIGIVKGSIRISQKILTERVK
jgi:hypothetical protein